MLLRISSLGSRFCSNKAVPALLLSLSLGHPGFAQTAPSSSVLPVDSKNTAEEVLELSPFEVTAEKDVGYQAGNTLSGSRMNTRLSETPASVSVFNEEFLRDLGATGLSQVLEYGLNANVDYAAGTTAPNFFFYDSALGGGLRVNNRGLTATQTVDFFETNFPIDTYNTGQVEISSGPNSVLFGFGNAGGIVNVSTRRPDLRRNILRGSFAMGTWDSFRGEIDANISLKKDIMALRVMAVHDVSETWRRFGDRKTDRQTAVLSYKPFKNTTVTAFYEHGEQSLPTTRPYNPSEYLSYWIQQGRPLIDNSALGANVNAVNNASGTRGYGVRNIWIGSDGIAAFTRTGNVARVLYRSASIYESGMTSSVPAYLQDAVTYQALLPTTADGSGLPVAPYDINYYGPDAVRTNKMDRGFLRVEQKVGKNGAIELAYSTEKASGFSNQLGGTYGLIGDPNRYLPNPDGSVNKISNPNAGRLFVDQTAYFNSEDREINALRATASWNVDLGRGGRHQLAAMVERSEVEFFTAQGPEILVNASTGAPILNATPDNGQNQLIRRNYVTEGRPETYIPAASFTTPVTMSYAGAQYTSRLISTANVGGTYREIDSGMVGTQSRFLNDRLIVTGGVRHDKVRIETALEERVAATDPLVTSGQKVLNEWVVRDQWDPVATQNYSFTNYSAGAVFGVTRQISAFYNQSANNGAPQTQRRILPSAVLPPPTEGVGQDFGIMFNLFDGRLFIRATRFDNANKNDPSIRDSSFIAAHRRILDALVTGNFITQTESDARYLGSYLGDFLSDQRTDGYEIEVKANPSKNLSITAAFSYTNIERTNLGTEWYPWFADQRAFYDRYPQNIVTSSGLPISTEISEMENGAENLFELNRLGYNNRPYKANAFVRYNFSQGRLRGLFVGVGARWQDKNILQRQVTGVDALGRDILGDVLYGPEIFTMDALLGYSTSVQASPLGRPGRLRFQINISNLLNNDDPQIIRLTRSGDDYARVAPREPFGVKLTTSFEF